MTGVACKYSDAYVREHKILAQMTFEEFTYMLGHLNDTLKAYWPCNCTIYTGYILAPFTFGLSFMLPNLCIADAKDNLVKAIARQNRLKLNEKGLHMVFVQGWFTSWIELRKVTQPESAAKYLDA